MIAVIVAGVIGMIVGALIVILPPVDGVIYEDQGEEDLLNKKEEEIQKLLADAYNLFVKLPELYHKDKQIFSDAIDQAHTMIMVRPVQRQANKEGRS